MTEQEGFDAIISKLRECARKGYESELFLSTYRDLYGFPIDSPEAPFFAFNTLKEQIFAGAYLISAYMTVSAKEGPDVRLSKFWKPFLDTKANEIIGLKLQAGQAMEYLSRVMQNNSLFWSLNKITVLPVSNKVQAVQSWMAMWIGSTFSPRNALENAGLLGKMCIDPLVEFVTCFEITLDNIYGYYTPPPPPPKKGFWGSIFG